MKHTIFMLTVAFGLGASCQKEVAEQTKTDHGRQLSESFSNPFESVGVSHNEALDYIVTYLGPGFKTESAENQLAALEAYANYKSEPFDVTLTHAQEVYGSIPSSNLDVHIADRISIFRSSADLSLQAADDLQAMFNELFSMELLGIAGYSTVSSNISAIEESVYNDGDYDSAEKEIVLQVGAMLRHSLGYWVDVASNPMHLRYEDEDITGIIGDAFADACAFLEDLIFNNENGRPKDVGRYASNMHANGF